MVEICIQANNKASTRTKNRLKENGFLFIQKDKQEFHHSFATSAILVQSNKTGWLGWFPSNEVFITEKGVTL